MNAFDSSGRHKVEGIPGQAQDKEVIVPLCQLLLSFDQTPYA